MPAAQTDQEVREGAARLQDLLIDSIHLVRDASARAVATTGATLDDVITIAGPATREAWQTSCAARGARRA